MERFSSAISGRGGYFVSSEGTRLAYREAGPADAPVLVFFYGLICSAYHFRYQWEELARDHRLVMVDYPAHHCSDMPQSVSTMTFGQFAEDALLLLEHLGVGGPVGVVGHSMGVNVALEFALRARGRVSSLVLIAGTSHFPVPSRRQAQAVRRLHAIASLVDGLAPRLVERLWRLQSRIPGADRVVARVGFNPALILPEDVRQCVEVFSGISPHVFLQLVREYLHHDVSARLGEIEAPALVLAGEIDRMVPADLVRTMHRCLRDSEFILVGKGSHCPQMERPELVNRAIREFLSRVAADQNPSLRSLETISLNSAT